VSLKELVLRIGTQSIRHLILPNVTSALTIETLRDGLQSPSVSEPPVEQKIELLHLMDALGSIPPTSACRERAALTPPALS